MNIYEMNINKIKYVKNSDNFNYKNIFNIGYIYIDLDFWIKIFIKCVYEIMIIV